MDDAQLTDTQSAKGSGQWLSGRAMELLGFAWAQHKQQPMRSCGAFLGVEHSMQAAATEHVVEFWPGAPLVQKVSDVVRHHRHTNLLTPADASKLRGMQNFLSQAEWGRLGRAMLYEVKNRQYAHVAPWTLSLRLDCDLAFLEFFMAQNIRRRVSVVPSGAQSVFIASDAQAEPGRTPTGGYLLTLPDVRQAAFCAFSSEVLAAWETGGEGQNPIALCEAAMIPLAMWHARGHLRRRRVIWLVDNTSALYAMVKGGSRNRHLHRTVVIYGFLAFFLECEVWLEFVDSDSNFADGVSRDLSACSWCHGHGFEPVPFCFSDHWWHMGLTELWHELRSSVGG